MTASIVGVTRTPSDGTDATGASLALTIPAGTAIDDYAVIIVELWDSTATNPTLTYPSGFGEIVNYVATSNGFQKLKVAIKKLTAADSGTYSVSGFASHFRQGHVAILRGIDLTTALDVAVNLAQNASGTALPANNITTVTDGCMLMHVIANENTSTGLPATGYTEQADSNYTKTNTKIQTTAGTDSPSGGSFSASTLKLGALIAFRPAAGGGATDLAVADAAQAQTSDNAALTQVHALAVQAATQAQTSDNAALTAVFSLTVQDSAHAQASDNATLTQVHALVAQSAAHAHAADAVTLTQVHALTIAAAAHAQTSDNLTLTQAHQLATQDAAHAHAADQVSLAGAGALAVQDSAHAHTVDAVTVAVTTALVVQDASHAHTAGGVALTQAHVLVAQSAIHAHTAGSATLTQLHQLVAASTAHAHFADLVEFVAPYDPPDEVEATPRPYISTAKPGGAVSTATARAYESTATARSLE